MLLCALVLGVVLLLLRHGLYWQKCSIYVAFSMVKLSSQHEDSK